MKYILGIFIGLFLLFFTLNYFNNSAKKDNKKKLIDKTLIVDSLQFKNNLLTIAIKQLEESKQRIDTVVKIVRGKTKVIYKDVPVIFDSTVTHLSDSIISDDLRLHYVADYIGELYGINFMWEVKENTIIKENIVKVPEPYPVEKLVPINVRMLYVGGQISTYNGLTPLVSVMYLDKRKRAFTASYGLDKTYQIGAYYRLFQ